MTKTVVEMKELFDKVNASDEGNVVPYSDTEYYAEQIQNIYGYSDKKSDELAKSLALMAISAEANDLLDAAATPKIHYSPREAKTGPQDTLCGIPWGNHGLAITDRVDQATCEPCKYLLAGLLKPPALKVTNVAGEYKDPEGLVECFRERLAEFGLVLTDDPDFDGEPDFGLILSNRPLTDEEVNAHRMFADRDDEDGEKQKPAPGDCSTDGDPGPVAEQVDPRIIIGEKEKFVELYLDYKYPVAVRLGNIAPDSLAMRDAEAAWAKIQGLKAARPDQAELVAEYINEGQHQDGVTYWDEFATLEEVIEDFDLVAKFEAESNEPPHTCTACGIGPSMVCANPNCKCKCHSSRQDLGSMTTRQVTEAIKAAKGGGK